MPINNKIEINIGDNMTKEEKPQPNISFGTVEGDAVIGDKVAGDKVEGDQDKSQGKTEIAGDMHGDIENTNIQAGTVNLEQVVKDLFDEMAKAAPELPEGKLPDPDAIAPRSIPQKPAEDAPEPVVIEDFGEPEEVKFEDFEDHPKMVFASVNQMQNSPKPATEEEQKSLFSRMYSCVKKYATSDEAVALGKLALSGIEATATVAPPLNVISAIVKTGIALTGKE